MLDVALAPLRLVDLFTVACHRGDRATAERG